MFAGPYQHGPCSEFSKVLTSNDAFSMYSLFTVPDISLYAFYISLVIALTYFFHKSSNIVFFFGYFVDIPAVPEGCMY